MTTFNKDAQDWGDFSNRLHAVLKPFASPVAITFYGSDQTPSAPRVDVHYPPPNEHGRTGQVPAGCVFWIHGATDTFATVAADHANCSVGSYTHGFFTLEQAASKDDVGAVLEAGWVNQESVMSLPHVSERPESVVYGPLSDCTKTPDVVLLRINGLGLMTMKDAFPDINIEGKPQCHIVAMAKDQNMIAASVGCALSRSRTGMRPEEMTCVIPGKRLQEVVETLEATVDLDRAMARYASADSKRFA